MCRVSVSRTCRHLIIGASLLCLLMIVFQNKLFSRQYEDVIGFEKDVYQVFDNVEIFNPSLDDWDLRRCDQTWNEVCVRV